MLCKVWPQLTAYLPADKGTISPEPFPELSQQSLAAHLVHVFAIDLCHPQPKFEMLNDQSASRLLSGQLWEQTMPTKDVPTHFGNHITLGILHAGSLDLIIMDFLFCSEYPWITAKSRLFLITIHYVMCKRETLPSIEG